MRAINISSQDYISFALRLSLFVIFLNVCLLYNSTQALKPHFLACSGSDEAPLIVFISKMFAVESEVLSKKAALTLEEISVRREAIRLRKLALSGSGAAVAVATAAVTFSEPVAEVRVIEEPSQKEEEEPESKHEFIAFARVFSGTLRKGNQYCQQILPKKSVFFQKFHNQIFYWYRTNFFYTFLLTHF